MIHAYVIASYSRASFVRAEVHPALREMGLTPTSSWAETATGPEDLATLDARQIRAAAVRNCRDLASADIVFMLADGWPQPREGFVELGEADALCKRVVFVGRPCLRVAWRASEGLCTVVATYAEGLEAVRRWVREAAR